MSDLIERLRECSKAWAAHGYEPDALVVDEAADLLEANAAEIARLKATTVSAERYTNRCLEIESKDAEIEHLVDVAQVHIDAAEILKAENEKLRDGLQEIADGHGCSALYLIKAAIKALAAVEQSEDQ